MDLDLETEVIHDRTTGDKEITGFKIGFVSTKMGAPSQGLTRPKPRWSNSTVWKLRDGSWVLITESWSRVYHTDPTTCRTVNRLPSGTRTTVREMMTELEALGLDFPGGAVSCDRCEPEWPEDLSPGDRVRYEFVRRSIYQCDTPAQVISELTRVQKFSGVTSIEVSEPVKALLEQCRDNDPDWVSDDVAVQKIG